MTMRFLSSAVIGLSLITAGQLVHAADSDRHLLRAEGKVELTSPPDKVWDLVGDFAGIHRWHPGIKGTTLLEGQNKMPLAVRELDLGEGQWLISELLEWDGNEHRLRYRILKSPLPIVNYVAVVTVTPTEQQGSLVTWKTEFRRRNANSKPEEDDAEVVKLIQGVIDQGLGNLPKVVN